VLLRRLGLTCGEGTSVLSGVDIGCPENLQTGNNSGIGLGCYLSCSDKMAIGDRDLMGPGMMVFTVNHVWNPERRTFYEQGEVRSPVTISGDAWIGARSINLPGVTIGRGCTVGAGSVVTRSTGDCSVVAGVPPLQVRVNPIR